MTSISNILNHLQTETNRVNFEYGRKNLGTDRLDKHAFLQLLAAKLQNQDPLNPVDNNDFLGQQAQLAQVEKLDDVANVLQLNSIISQAGSLVGRKVDVIEPDGKTVSTGTIESVSFAEGNAGLSINGKIYTMGQVNKIYAQ